MFMGFLLRSWRWMRVMSPDRAVCNRAAPPGPGERINQAKSRKSCLAPKSPMLPEAPPSTLIPCLSGRQGKRVPNRLWRYSRMKFVSFRAGGAARYGLVDGNRVVDLTRRLKYPDLKTSIVADAFVEAGRAAKGATADFALDQIAFDPVIPNPGKIICVGLNYHEHRNETGMT